MHVLITGGAGFIGAQLTRRLAELGAVVTVLDSLSPQIHGASTDFSRQLLSQAQCIKGDICDAELLKELLEGQEVVIHLAAETGTGQSMYAVEHYGRVNIQGTAVLLNQIVNNRPESLTKLIVASSRAVYGEGGYICATHDLVFPAARRAQDMAVGQFEPLCPYCAECVEPVATTEAAPFGPSSFYGLTKQVQEQMVLMFAAALGIDGFALRYQNVYGPGQSLSNPYTGILAIFSNLVRQGKPLNIFEDGHESRDFVHVDDVVTATAACAGRDVHGVTALNVGSGLRTSVLEVANAIVRYFNVSVPVEITGAFRVGDIRHSFADISRISQLTGFAPQWSFQDGIRQFLAWAEGHEAGDAGFDRSLEELKQRGLMQSSTPRGQR